MIKKLSILFLSVILLSGLATPTASFAVTGESRQMAAAVKKVVKKKAVAKPLTAGNLIGRLILQKESGNKLWYIEPTAKERYYLRNDEDVSFLIYAVGVKASVAEFSRLGKSSRTRTPADLVKKYGGAIIISPLDGKTAYYLNPADSVAYIINGYIDLYAVAKVIGLSATDALLRQISMNSRQDTYDPAFYGIAYARYDGENYYDSRDADRLLPLASLTKVMTALVFIETKPDFNKVIEITPEEISYPCTLQACGTTSEIDLKAGDKLRVIDLWVAMLSASSNQAAVILADNSGMSRQEFIAKMNQKAKDLGLARTRFAEMSGLSADNVSTAKEFAVVAKVAFYNSWVAQATRSVDYVFTAQTAEGTAREVKVLNRNASLLAMGPDASKTGYLVEAQRNAVVDKDGNIVIALHCYSLRQRNEIVERLLGNSKVSLAP